MTLKNLLINISNLAIREKIINSAMAGTSLYSINPKNIEGYPVLFSSPTGDHLVEEYTTTFNITLFYFDRLSEGDENDIDIYSSAVEQLKSLINKIGDIEGVLKVEDGYSITNFADTESFDDRLCGGYATIDIVTDNKFLCDD